MESCGGAGPGGYQQNQSWEGTFEGGEEGEDLWEGSRAVREDVYLQVGMGTGQGVAEADGKDRTCAKEQSCVLCVDCFHAADHEGHEVLFGQSFSFAAACDCGDPTAWRDDEHLGCSHHPRLPRGAQPRSYPQGYNTDDPRIPPALIKAMYETVVLCLEFIIQVFIHSPLPTEYGNLPKDEIEMRLAENNTGEARERRGKGPWSVVLWADEKHVAKEVTRQIRDSLGVSWETAERHAEEVEGVVGRLLTGRAE